MSYAAANSSVFRCALKVMMITGDREFQTVVAVILNALAWNLEVDPCACAGGVGKSCVLEHKSGISETRKDGGKITMKGL